MSDSVKIETKHKIKVQRTSAAPRADDSINALIVSTNSCRMGFWTGHCAEIRFTLAPTLRLDSPMVWVHR